MAQSETAVSIIAPTLVGVGLLLFWELACRADITPTVQALGMTLRVALQAFV